MDHLRSALHEENNNLKKMIENVSVAPDALISLRAFQLGQTKKRRKIGNVEQSFFVPVLFNKNRDSFDEIVYQRLLIVIGFKIVTVPCLLVFVKIITNFHSAIHSASLLSPP